MTDPLEKATSKAPPKVGEGCLSRYDVDSLTDEDGATFDGAAELWQQLQQEPGTAQASVPGPLDNSGNCEEKGD